jgi:hypothetical protein
MKEPMNSFIYIPYLRDAKFDGYTEFNFRVQSPNLLNSPTEPFPLDGMLGCSIGSSPNSTPTISSDRGWYQIDMVNLMAFGTMQSIMFVSSDSSQCIRVKHELIIINVI